MADKPKSQKMNGELTFAVTIRKTVKVKVDSVDPSDNAALEKLKELHRQKVSKSFKSEYPKDFVVTELMFLELKKDVSKK